MNNFAFSKSFIVDSRMSKVCLFFSGGIWPHMHVSSMAGVNFNNLQCLETYTKQCPSVVMHTTYQKPATDGATHAI